MARKKDNGLDFYATEPKAVEDFLTLTDVQLDNKVWECACGIGSISNVLKSNQHDVYSTDIVNRGYNDATLDFLQCTEAFDGDIMTNPPFNLVDNFINKGLELTQRRLLLLVPLAYIQTMKRYQLIEQYKCTIYIYLKRINIAKDAQFEKYINKTKACYCWLVFDKETTNKEITIKYIKNNINPIKIKAMPKVIDLLELKKNFDEKATEKEKQSYESKDTDEKKNEYLKKWNREENKKNNPIDTLVDITQQQQKEQTPVEMFIDASKKVLRKQKLTLQEIKEVETKIEEVIKKLNELRSKAEEEAKEANIDELRKQFKEAAEQEAKAAAAKASAEEELNKLGVPLEAPKKEEEQAAVAEEQEAAPEQ